MTPVLATPADDERTPTVSKVSRHAPLLTPPTMSQIRYFDKSVGFIPSIIRADRDVSPFFVPGITTQ